MPLESDPWHTKESPRFTRRLKRLQAIAPSRPLRANRSNRVVAAYGGGIGHAEIEQELEAPLDDRHRVGELARERSRQLGERAHPAATLARVVEDVARGHVVQRDPVQAVEPPADRDRDAPAVAPGPFAASRPYFVQAWSIARI